ncbi:hypothetical protein ACOQFL_19990 [Actinopolyspora sp. H202]|uniref:hypothetical protein n=1 Tax=Actinopolyspora sp. H202 TaxID=1500456 RepID=UPI003EE72BBE
MACFCGQAIELAPCPPERILGGWHHYCRVCFQYVIGGSESHPPSPRNSYEPWLCELAHLDSDSPTEMPPSGWRDVPCHQQRYGQTVVRLKPTASGIALLAPVRGAVSLFTLAEARQLREALDAALREREGWSS